MAARPTREAVRDRRHSVLQGVRPSVGQPIVTAVFPQASSYFMKAFTHCRPALAAQSISRLSSGHKRLLDDACLAYQLVSLFPRRELRNYIRYIDFGNIRRQTRIHISLAHEDVCYIFYAAPENHKRIQLSKANGLLCWLLLLQLRNFCH